MNFLIMTLLFLVGIILWNMFLSKPTIAKNSYPEMYDVEPKSTFYPKRNQVEENFLQMILNASSSVFVEVQDKLTYPLYCIKISDQIKGISVNNHMGQKSGGYLYIVDFKTKRKDYIELNDDELLNLKNKFAVIEKELDNQQKNNNLTLSNEFTNFVLINEKIKH